MCNYEKWREEQSELASKAREREMVMGKRRREKEWT